MFPDYEKLVLQDYKWKKSKSAISSELMHPTRAKLKKVCIRLCNGEISSQDKKVIRDFCKKWDETKTFIQNIASYDEDKFRPLSDYLNDTTGNKNTDPTNIELLACLIHFQHRPYDYTKNYVPLLEIQAGATLIEQEAKADSDIVHNTTIEIQSEINNLPLEEAEISVRVSESIRETAADTFTVQAVPSTDVDVESTQVDNQKKEIKSGFSKVLRVGVLFIILLAGYWWYRFEMSLSALETGGCMYWTGDHFEPIPCDKKIQDTYVVALDTLRLRHFKKIIPIDTITHRARGWVWYSKINNHLEYFTADGKHPISMNYDLKPITYYIIDTYIHPPGK